MNGLSDVRLALYSQELSSGKAVVAKTASGPKLGRWALYRHRWMSRRGLLNLTEEQLRDIGLSSAQAMHEGLKPFWRE
ncbi:DUF1127 domain-containing protein [Pseudomonas syringae group sp. J309-1]|uniref:DUF1127 domain-containing protein n=1 Tax=Pseudomonas syringae group sp. J309-1 TaxID=3079588 RepID=UPI000F0525F8|nr:DUF1127 domain-containing protein [Pseudomonas syringae group sp. J309-1]MDU8358817.1 DUF1127 domain-containing protein [Pseudomonas syringae group sp. J309-1]